MAQTQLVTVYWRDIPAQVMAKRRRESKKIELNARFADAIDRAAMRAGLIGTDAYLEQWRREAVDCGEDLVAEVAAAAQAIEQQYDKVKLKQLIKNLGNEPETG